MDSALKVSEFVTPKNKYTIFYYKIPVSFGSPYVQYTSLLMDQNQTGVICSKWM